jgi:hypothetical protein
MSNQSPPLQPPYNPHNTNSPPQYDEPNAQNEPNEPNEPNKPNEPNEPNVLFTKPLPKEKKINTKPNSRFKNENNKTAKTSRNIKKLTNTLKMIAKSSHLAPGLGLVLSASSAIISKASEKKYGYTGIFNILKIIVDDLGDTLASLEFSIKEWINKTEIFKNKDILNNSFNSSKKFWDLEEIMLKYISDDNKKSYSDYLKIINPQIITDNEKIKLYNGYVYIFNVLNVIYENLINTIKDLYSTINPKKGTYDEDYLKRVNKKNLIINNLITMFNLYLNKLNLIKSGLLDSKYIEEKLNELIKFKIDNTENINNTKKKLKANTKSFNNSNTVMKIRQGITNKLSNNNFNTNFYNVGGSNIKYKLKKTLKH